MASFGGDDNNEGDVNIPAPTSVVTFGQVIVRVMGFERPLLGLRDTSCVQINQDIARIDPRVFGGSITQPSGQDEFLFNHGSTSSRHWGDKITYSLGLSYLIGTISIALPPVDYVRITLTLLPPLCGPRPSPDLCTQVQELGPASDSSRE